MATAEQKRNFVKRVMVADPERALKAVEANTTTAEKTAILTTLSTMPPHEELAQLIAFRDRFMGGDADIFAAVEARITALSGG